MGIFDRFKKKSEDSVSQERLSEIFHNTMILTANNDTQNTESYFKTLSENELKAIFNQIKRMYVLDEPPYDLNDKLNNTRDIAKKVLKTGKKSTKIIEKADKITDKAVGAIGETQRALLELHPETKEQLLKLLKLVETIEEQDIQKEAEEKNKKEEAKKPSPLGSFLKDETGTLPRREKPEDKESKEKTGLFDFLKGKPKTEEQIALEMEKKTKNIVKDLYFKVSDFWGISKGEIKGKIPKVRIFPEEEYKKAIDSGFIIREEEGKLYLDEEKNLIIAPLSFLKEEEKTVGFDGLKAMMAEEASHKIDGIVMQRPTIHSEFFAMVSRVLFAEIAPGSFKKEYGNYMRIAAAFKYSLKSLLDKEEYLKDSFSKAKSIEELNASFDKVVEVQRLLNHILQLPALASCFYIQKLSKEDRHNLLVMDPEKLHKDVVYEVGVKNLEEIRKKMESRLEYNKDRNYREFYEKFVKLLAENPNPEEKIVLTEGNTDTIENRKKILKDAKKEMIRYYTKGLENVGTFYEKAEKGEITENKEAIAAAEAIDYKQEERAFEEEKQLEKQFQSLLKPIELKYTIKEAEKIKKFPEKIPEEKAVEMESRLATEMQTEENEILLCPHCGEEFTEKDNLNYAEHLKNHEFSKQGPIAATPEFIKKQKAIIEDFLKSGEYIDKLPESPQISALSSLLSKLKGKIPKEEEAKLRKQIDLQNLTDMISLKLAGFWGVPKDKTFTPFIKILSAEEAKQLGVPILKMFPKEPIGSDILINSEYLSNEFQGRMDIKSVLAEEVCHSMEDFVKAYGYKEDKYVAEFFGLISRLYIAEQSPELFKDEYKKFLNSKSAIFFSEEKKQVDSLLAQCEQDKKMLRHLQIEGRQPANLVESKIGKIDDAERRLNDYRDHLAYYPAAAYFFEISKMKPEKRWELYKMNNEQIRKEVIEGEPEKILAEIGLKILEREERMVEESVKADLKIPLEAETAQFYERTEKEAKEKTQAIIKEIESIPTYQRVEDVLRQEVKLGDPDFEKAEEIRIENNETREDIGKKLEQILRGRNWWLQDEWREKGIPKEQLEITAGNHKIDVYNFGEDLSDKHLEELKRTIKKFSLIEDGKLLDNINYILLNNKTKVNPYSGEEQRGFSYPSMKAIELDPKGIELTPYRIEKVSDFEGTLIHELSHQADTLFINDWNKKFGWEFVDNPTEKFPNGEPIFWRNKIPEKCINSYAAISPYEDITESMTAALINSEALDPEKLQFLKEILMLDKIDIGKAPEIFIEKRSGKDVKLPELELSLKYKIVEHEKENEGVEAGAIAAGAAIANELNQNKTYDESIKDHVKERVFGIPIGQQSNKTSPVQIKAHERSDIEQTSSSGAIAAEEAINYKQEERVFEEERRELEEGERRIQEEEKLIEQEQKEFEEIEQEQKEFDEIVEKQKELERKKLADT